MNTLVNLLLLAFGLAFLGVSVASETQRCLNARKIARFLDAARKQQAFDMGYFDGSRGRRSKLDTFGDPLTRLGYAEGFTQGQQEITAAFYSCMKAYSEETN